MLSNDISFISSFTFLGFIISFEINIAFIFLLEILVPVEYLSKIGISVDFLYSISSLNLNPILVLLLII